MVFLLLRAWWRFGGGCVQGIRPRQQVRGLPLSSRRRAGATEEGSRNIYCGGLMKGSMVMREMMSQLLVVVELLLITPPRRWGQARRERRMHSYYRIRQVLRYPLLLLQTMTMARIISVGRETMMMILPQFSRPSFKQPPLLFPNSRLSRFHFYQ